VDCATDLTGGGAHTRMLLETAAEQLYLSEGLTTLGYVYTRDTT
jgi:hypothetical protein